MQGPETVILISASLISLLLLGLLMIQGNRKAKVDQAANDQLRALLEQLLTATAQGEVARASSMDTLTSTLKDHARVLAENQCRLLETLAQETKSSAFLMSTEMETIKASQKSQLDSLMRVTEEIEKRGAGMVLGLGKLGENLAMLKATLDDAVKI